MRERRLPSIVPVRDASVGFGMVPRLLFPWIKGPLWRLEENYLFELKSLQGGRFCIPAGYEFDKASVPPLFWGPPFNYLPDGLCTVPALEHDFLCDLLSGGSPWLCLRLQGLPECPEARMVHAHFLTRLLECGVRPGKARAMGRAVAAFGPGGWLRKWLLPAGVIMTVFLMFL